MGGKSDSGQFEKLLYQYNHVDIVYVCIVNVLTVPEGIKIYRDLLSTYLFLSPSPFLFVNFFILFV